MGNRKSGKCNFTLFPLNHERAENSRYVKLHTPKRYNNFSDFDVKFLEKCVKFLALDDNYLEKSVKYFSRATARSPLEIGKYKFFGFTT